MGVRLSDAIVYFMSDDSELKKGFNRSEADTKSWAGRVGSAVKTAATGAMVAGAVAATAAIVGIGKAALDVSSDTRAAANDMAASLGIPTEEAQRFAEVAKDVFANNFASDVREAGDAVGILIQQFGKLNDVELQNLAENAFAIRDAFDVDYADVISTAKTLTKEFGLSGEEAMDLIAKGFQVGLDRSGDFLDTVNEYSLQFGDAGASAAYFFSLLEGGLQSGMLGTDKAADLFKEFTVRIQDGADATNDALRDLFGGTIGNDTDFAKEISKSEKNLEKYRNQLELARVKQGEFNEKTKESTRLASQQKIEELTRKIQEEEAAIASASTAQANWNGEIQGALSYQGGMSQFLADLNSGALTQAEAFVLIQQALRAVDNDAQRFQLGVALLGTQFEDLGEEAFFALETMSDSFHEIGDATDSLNAQYQNFGDLFSAVWRKFIVAVTPVTDKLLELAIERMPQVQAAIDKLAPVIEDFAVNALVPMVDKLFEWIDAMIEAAPSTEELIPIIENLIQKGKDFVNNAIVPIIEKIAEWVGAFRNLSPETQSLILKITGVLAVITPLLAIFGPLIAAIGSLISVFGTLIPVVTTVGGAIAGLVGGPITIVIAAVAALALAWETNFLGIRDKTEVAMSAIGGYIKSGWESIKRWWQGGAQSVESDTDSFWTRTENAFRTGGESIKSTANSIWESVKSAFVGIKTSIQDAFNFDWSSLGSSVSSGIISGISSGTSGIVSAAQNAAQSALNAAKSALQSNSPSRRADREVGITIPQGIARGVRRGMPEVAAALRQGIDGVMNVQMPQFGGLQQTRNYAPISVVQNFYGEQNRNEVREAAQFGVRDALRMAGVAA